MTVFRRRCVLALGVLAPASLLAAALPASAATTTVLSYIGTADATRAIDKSGQGNNGTLHNVTAAGGIYSFGSDAYISVPASASINPGTANYSYGVTMRLPAGYAFTYDLSLVRRGASKDPGAYYKMELIYNGSTGKTHLVCALRDEAGNTGYVSTGVTGLTDGNWHTLTCSKTATTVSLAKDSSIYTRPATLGNLSSPLALNFGAEQKTDTTYLEHFPGDMDNITITKG